MGIQGIVDSVNKNLYVPGDPVGWLSVHSAGRVAPAIPHQLHRPLSTILLLTVPASWAALLDWHWHFK